MNAYIFIDLSLLDNIRSHHSRSDHSVCSRILHSRFLNCPLILLLLLHQKVFQFVLVWHFSFNIVSLIAWSNYITIELPRLIISSASTITVTNPCNLWRQHPIPINLKIGFSKVDRRFRLVNPSSISSHSTTYSPVDPPNSHTSLIFPFTTAYSFTLSGRA